MIREVTVTQLKILLKHLPQGTDNYTQNSKSIEMYIK
jgi:hypothetical protein